MPGYAVIRLFRCNFGKGQWETRSGVRQFREAEEGEWENGKMVEREKGRKAERQKGRKGEREKAEDRKY